MVFDVKALVPASIIFSELVMIRLCSESLVCFLCFFDNQLFARDLSN